MEVRATLAKKNVQLVPPNHGDRLAKVSALREDSVCSAVPITAGPILVRPEKTSANLMASAV